jgi:MFS family permease
MRVGARLGPLAERNFSLLFLSATVSRLGDGIATVALAFAVLETSGSATDLGIVLAARQVAEAALVLAGGVVADRLPRHRVLTGAAMLQGGAQAGTATLVLGGDASLPALVALQLLYGAGDGFVLPATTGLVPETLPGERLQQGNALLGLTTNTAQVLGPALGGVLVVASSPGTALAVDAASFVVAGSLLAGLRPLARAEAPERGTFFGDLRGGWDEFRSRTWLWGTVLLFGTGNLAFAAYWVLGPFVSQRELGGASAWATLVTAFGAGSVVGGLVALRIRPSRPLLASVLATVPVLFQFAALAVPLPLPLLAAAAALGGAGIAVHLALWFTVLQQQIPPEAVARVSSYDALGSFVLLPLGSAIAGPLADAIGIRETLLLVAAIDAACIAAILAMPSVRAIRRPP